LNSELLEEVTEIAASVAKQIHPRYAVYFEPQDLKQELLLWSLNHEHKIVEWLNPDQEVWERKAGIRQLAKSFQREADKICRAAKARKTGYEIHDEYFYSRGVLEELLTNLDEIEAQQTGMQVRVSGGGSDPAAGNNIAASVADVRKALDQLDPMDRLMVEMKYQEQLTYKQISETVDLSDSTVHRRVSGALNRMVKFLGGDNPYTGSNYRKTISNAQAQAMTE
jgi:RNA polymerase sigma factor (sigma-70 family)